MDQPTHQLSMTVWMTPDTANFAGNVHGGTILKLLDQVAYACASRYVCSSAGGRASLSPSRTPARRAARSCRRHLTNESDESTVMRAVRAGGRDDEPEAAGTARAPGGPWAAPREDDRQELRSLAGDLGILTSTTSRRAAKAPIVAMRRSSGGRHLDTLSL